jgi:3-oxoacyl-[acyl-carrier protein] reductase
VPSEAAHAVVTGAGAGIGQAIAQRLLDDGWHVTGVDRSAAGLERPGYEHRQMDLADEEATDRLATALAGAGVQALVHAAGVLRVAPLGALRSDDAEAMWRLHVSAACRLADRLLPAMAAAGFGRVVLIGSRAAEGIAGRSQYAASKAALRGLARSWAAELVQRGVTVNVVAPAATDTGMLADPARAVVPPRLPPMGRLIRPSEVAAAVAFLLSDDAAPITGQVLTLCGGASLPR